MACVGQLSSHRAHIRGSQSSEIDNYSLLLFLIHPEYIRLADFHAYPAATASVNINTLDWQRITSRIRFFSYALAANDNGCSLGYSDGYLALYGIDRSGHTSLGNGTFTSSIPPSFGRIFTAASQLGSSRRG